MNKTKAKVLLKVGKRKLKECKTLRGRKAIKKTNKYLIEVIKDEKNIKNFK